MSAGATARALRASGAAAPARPLTRPPRPRRVSGPARRRVPDRAVGGRSQDEAGIAVRLLAALDGLSRHRALGGRTWIGLVAFALIGIVTLQLGLLKLNAGIGRALEHEAVLQRENAALSIENSELANPSRISSAAVRLGMEPVPVGALRFLQVRGGIDLARGAGALSAPAHTAAAGSGESAAGASPAGSASAASAPSEQSTASQATTSSAGESSGAGSTTAAGAATAAPASSSGESSSRAAEAAPAQTAESTQAAAGTPAASAAAPSSSAEGGPGGAMSASPSG